MMLVNNVVTLLSKLKLMKFNENKKGVLLNRNKCKNRRINQAIILLKFLRNWDQMKNFEFTRTNVVKWKGGIPVL